jgi:single-stranded-DNA-specific exonuclease
MKRNWRILEPEPQAVESLVRALGCMPLTAGVLVNRGLTEPIAVRDFLYPSINRLRPPFALKGLSEGVERIVRAVVRRERILIFGDYDVDGVTSTVLLTEFLKGCGADAQFYLPDRIKDGYGLKERHIDEVALPRGINLLVTADCGSGSHSAAQRSAAAGIDLVITDHHRISTPHPKALAVINPQREDCTAGFEHLAGVGVSMAVVIALRKHLRDEGWWAQRPEPNLRDLCDLVALGTIADAVPLVAENRIYVHTGLEIMRSNACRQGLLELLNLSGANRSPEAEDLAFKLVPRLNAAGRMDHPDLAARLLLASDRQTANALAACLNELNLRRKETELALLKQVREYLSNHPQERDRRSLVLAGPNWHEGVLGIVAARLVEEFLRPVVLITVRDGLGKGSARSIPGFNLYRGLTACGAFLQRYGGHSMAAGLKIEAKNIGAFRQAFEHAVQSTAGEQQKVPDLLIDADLTFEQVSDRLIDEIEALKPFGSGNREPMFMSRNVAVQNAAIVGDRHMRLELLHRGPASGSPMAAIAFNIDPQRGPPRHFDRIAFHLQWNRWNGRKTPQLVVAASEPVL